MSNSYHAQISHCLQEWDAKDHANVEYITHVNRLTGVQTTRTVVKPIVKVPTAPPTAPPTATTLDSHHLGAVSGKLDLTSPDVAKITALALKRAQEFESLKKKNVGS